MENEKVKQITVASLADELPFSTPRQLALLGNILTDKVKYHQVKDKIKIKWFNDKWAGDVLSLWLKWSELYDPNNEKFPTYEEIKDLEDFKKLDSGQQRTLNDAYQKAIAAMGMFDWDAIAIELTSWLRCRIYLENVSKSTELYNNKKYVEAFGLLEKSVKEYQSVRFFQNDVIDFSDWVKHFSESEKERMDGLTTGLSVLDNKIDPNCTKGCLLKGDTTILLASTGVGKTSTMITMTCANLRNNKDVLFVLHEGRATDVVDKFWCNITGNNKAELLSLYKTSPNRFIAANSLFRDHLTLMSIQDPALMTVEHVAREIERKQQEHIQKKGKGYDLLVIDYPAKLQSEISNKVQMAFRQLEHYVYNYFVQLALKHQFHALLAIQTNREASKNNRYQGAHGTQARLVSLEDVAESWGPITVATNVISINRNDTYGDKVIFHICKTRSSETGVSVLAKADYERCRTHSDTMGALWYRGNTSAAKVTNELLLQFKNNQLPGDILAKYEE